MDHLTANQTVSIKATISVGQAHLSSHCLTQPAFIDAIILYLDTDIKRVLVSIFNAQYEKND